VEGGERANMLSTSRALASATVSRAVQNREVIAFSGFRPLGTGSIPSIEKNIGIAFFIGFTHFNFIHAVKVPRQILQCEDAPSRTRRHR